MRKRAEIKITGEVQGVFFRQGVKDVAAKLGLTGWVRNEVGGSVKIMAEGEEADLQKLIKWCRVGTEWSQVEKIKTQWSESSEEFHEFVIL